jgi:hypothetical protein
MLMLMLMLVLILVLVLVHVFLPDTNVFCRRQCGSPNWRDQDDYEYGEALRTPA